MSNQKMNGKRKFLFSHTKKMSKYINNNNVQLLKEINLKQFYCVNWFYNNY